MRLFERNDTALAAALIVGVFLLFHQPLQVVFDAAHDIERQYQIDLVQSLVVLSAVFGFHQYRKQQQTRAALAAADADARQAQIRAHELERLVGLSRALAVATDFTGLHRAFSQYLPKFTHDRRCWLLLCQADCWDVLVRPSADQRPADELSALAVHALAGCAGASSTRAGGLACFPLIVGGHVVGVLLVEEMPALADPDSRALEGAAAVGAVAIRNVQAFLEARENSLRDQLTGCFNRGHALDTLNRELRRARRGHLPLSVLMFDVDYFKQVNDTHGHLTGDRVLAEVGRRLTELLRVSDIKCRYGGDEFLLILPETPRSGAYKLAESLRREMAQIVVAGADQHDVQITVSIGVVTTHGDMPVDVCIGHADAALYRAKHAGRNCFQVADAEPVAPSTARAGRSHDSQPHQGAPDDTRDAITDMNAAGDNRERSAMDESTQATLADLPAQMHREASEAAARPRILVVDDEGAVRSLAERVLRDAHYQVITAAGGSEALEIADTPSAFDLFVLDVMMPHMTGSELARQLRLREPDVKVLYCTGYADRLFQTQPTLGEHEAFLEKPMTNAGLREAVSLLLFGHTHGPDAAAPTAAC